MTKWHNTPDKGGKAAVLPRANKIPKQERSRSLVKAIREACLLILSREGAEALTTNRIAEVAGVGIASVYQYFPNKQAIIAAVYEEILDEERRALEDNDSVALFEQLGLRGNIDWFIDNAIDLRLRLLDLAPDFFRLYHNEFSLAEKIGLQESVKQGGRLFESYKDQLRVEDSEALRFIFVRGLGAIIDRAAEERPEQLRDPEFRALLKEMAVRLLVAGQ